LYEWTKPCSAAPGGHCHASWSRLAAQPVEGPTIDAAVQAWHGPETVYSQPVNTRMHMGENNMIYTAHLPAK